MIRSVTFLAHTPSGGPFAIGSHYLAAAMVDQVERVTHVSLPVTPFHLARLRDDVVRLRFRRALGGARDVGRVRDVVPLGLVPSEAVFGRSYLAGVAARARLPRLGSLEQDLVICDHPGAGPAAARLRRRCLIYRPTDVYRHMYGDRVLPLERAILELCDGVVATSQVVAEGCRNQGYAGPLLTLPNGIGAPRAEMGEDDGGAVVAHVLQAARGRPVVIYVGAMDERFDGALFERMAATLPDALFVAVGPLGQLAAPQGEQGVILLGPRPPSVARRLMQTAAVGVLPLSDHPANAGRSPMKLLELVESGCRVVAKRTVPLATMQQQLPGAIDLYDDGSRAIELVRLAIDQPALAGSAIPQEFTWSSNASQLLRFAEEVTP